MNNNKISSRQASSNGGDSRTVEYLTIKEACGLIKMSRWSIKRRLRLKDGEGNYIIRWHKIGKSRNSPVRIDKASFLAFLESHLQYAENAPHQL